MEFEKIRIVNAEVLSALFDERGIAQEDVQRAIASAEETGEKFYSLCEEGRFLARALVGKLNVYCEYSLSGEGFWVHTVYAHRIRLAATKELHRTGPKTKWGCFRCRAAVEDVDDIGLMYLDLELPDAVGYRCPVCGLQMLSENLVMTQLFMAEMMLEAK